MNSLADRALIFASFAHDAVKQVRKYTGEPYIVHPIEVADIVKTVPHIEEMVAAAYLHDVLEDTNTNLETLVREFGPQTANLVLWLTAVTTPKDGNRAYRKAIELEYLAQAPAEAQTVKLADLISNTSSIVGYDPSFAKVYLKEKLDLLQVLTKGDKTLHSRANELCWQYLLL